MTDDEILAPQGQTPATIGDVGGARAAADAATSSYFSEATPSLEDAAESPVDDGGGEFSAEQRWHNVGPAEAMSL